VLVVDRDDPGLRCLDVSPAVFPLLGYWPEALADRPLRELVHPDDRDLIADEALVRLRHRQGRWVPVVVTNTADPTRLGIAASDVAERMRVEEWTVTERLITDRMLSMASDAILNTDRDGVVVGWNRAAEQMFGWSREEAVGREAAELIVPPAGRDETREGVRTLWASGGARVDEPVEMVLMRRDGQEVEVELTAWSVQVGRTWRFSAVVRDITARKEAERELQRARESADEASRMKTELMATVSHEIRTPMNGVIGLADVLLTTDLEPTQRRYAEGIRTAGTALLGVINDILDFSKAEAGKIALDEAPFDLRDLIEEVADVMAGPARAKGLELVDYVRADVPVALVGDPGRLRQVLLNLCGNAVKFTERGEVTITARLSSSTMDGTVRPVVRVEVTDTGIGIRAEDQDRMFQAFSQADASTTRQYGGTGLGLAICLRIMQAMEGKIGVVSEPGRGSTFWFEFPVRPQAGSGPAPGRSLDLRGLKVLVVDDNATNRVVLDSQLREWRLVPTSVGSGAEALAELRDRHDSPYEVAILDMAMPTMDGVELARRISDDPAIPGLHLILASSGLDVDPTAARAAGVGAWLTKPVRRSQLFDSLAQVLAPSEPERAAADEEPGTSRGHLLVAEDNEINRLVAIGILGGIGYTADVAENGAEALDMLARRGYDGVLMDCQMPVMDGYTATAELRTREGDARHTPVIALTASARWEDRDRCLAAGMDDFVSKPVSHRALAQALDRWIPAEAEPSLVDEDEVVGDVEAAVTARLAMVAGAGPEGAPLIRQLVDAYLDHTPGELDELTEALEREDFATVAGTAHRLKGSAANIGAERLAGCLGEIETVARTGQRSGAVHHLREEYDAAAQALRRELVRVGGDPAW
jgi:PAS domain S-box-containing protein